MGCEVLLLRPFCCACIISFPLPRAQVPYPVEQVTTQDVPFEVVEIVEKIIERTVSVLNGRRKGRNRKEEEKYGGMDQAKAELDFFGCWGLGICSREVPP